jgi:aralkylamine N-acetyltransferase
MIPCRKSLNVEPVHMRIERSDAAISWQDVTNLFKAIGWGDRSADEVQAAFARSTFKIFAFDDVELLGFGRTIDDGRFYANIVDVVVSPIHQRKGVGRAIVEDLQSRLNGFLVVTLTAAPEVQRFYRRLGWRHRTTAMMRPRSKEQALLNCSEEEA